jgi:predicted Zn-dependent peptidase
MVSRTILDNGICILSETIGHVRSVSVGLWIRGGSAREDTRSNGMTHFVEHMLFKGTTNRSAFDIASAIDSVGGIMNAFSAKEMSAFHIKIPDYQLTLAVDLLADIFRHSLFEETEIAKEKTVILQEIHMLEDTPDDYIHDFFEARFWGDHPLGLPILGTMDRIQQLTKSELLRFFKDRYGAENLVITASGHLEHQPLVDMIRESFDPVSRGITGSPISPPDVSSNIAVVEKDLEQVHFIVGTLGPSAMNTKRYAGFVLNTVLGGSMSSRLFQEIREARGLAYAVQSFLLPYSNTGILGVYAATAPADVRETLGVIFDAIGKIVQERVSDKELESAKELIKGNFLLAMESTDSCMSRLARNEIYFQRDLPVEEILAAVDAVTANDIKDLAGEIFNPSTITVAAMGPISEKDLALDILTR